MSAQALKSSPLTGKGTLSTPNEQPLLLGWVVNGLHFRRTRCHPFSCVFFGHRHSNASLPCASPSRNTAVRRLFLVCPAKRRVVCLAISGSRLWLISASCSTLTCYRVSLYLPFFTVSPCFWRLYFLLLPISMCIFIFLIAQAITKLNFSPVNLNQSNFTSPQANLYCTLQAKIASAGLQLLTCNRHLS